MVVAPRRRSPPASSTGSAKAGIRSSVPRAAAARIESSKAFAKDVMVRHGVPTAAARTFTDSDALAYIAATPSPSW